VKPERVAKAIWNDSWVALTSLGFARGHAMGMFDAMVSAMQALRWVAEVAQPSSSLCESNQWLNGRNQSMAGWLPASLDRNLLVVCLTASAGCE